LIEYDGRTDVMKVIRNAQLRRYRGATLDDEFTGGVILYNNTTEVVSIDGAVAKAGAPAGRVRAMLMPKPEAGAPAPAAVGASAPLPLRSTTTMGGEKK
jgi:lipopolysaccharide export system protein LptA